MVNFILCIFDLNEKYLHINFHICMNSAGHGFSQASATPFLFLLVLTEVIQLANEMDWRPKASLFLGFVIHLGVTR